MGRYRVTAFASQPDDFAGLALHRTISAPCAERAACELAEQYVEAGLVVDWQVRGTGLRRFGRRWSGRFIPGDDDGLAGVREPRRQPPSAGSAAAAAIP